MKQCVFVLGSSGNVGREFLRQVMMTDSRLSHRNPTRIVGIANRSHYYFDDTGIDPSVLKQCVSSRAKAGAFLSKKKSFEDLREVLKQVEKSRLKGQVIFVDATAGRKALKDFHLEVIQKTENNIVTANKNPLALSTMKEFYQLTEYHHRYHANTTVMAGAGAVDFLIQSRNVLDSPIKIEGMFSGTIGFILSQLERGKQSFSSIVRQAHEKGLTEPHPWDDLNGLDVARKLLILARYGGYEVELKDIQLRPLIDERYGKLESPEAFLEALSEEESDWDQAIRQHKANNEVPRYVAFLSLEGTKIELKAGLGWVKKPSWIGSLEGTSNIFRVETQHYTEELPHIITSPGAGVGLTAKSLRIGVAHMLGEVRRR